MNGGRMFRMGKILAEVKSSHLANALRVMADEVERGNASGRHEDEHGNTLTGWDAYYQPLTPKLQKLIRALENIYEHDDNVQDEVDDLIYGLYGGDTASAINNSGFEGQVETLSEEYGKEEAARLLQKIVDEWKTLLKTLAAKEKKR